MPRNLQERTLLMFSPSWICGCLLYLLIISNSLKMLSKPLKREGTREQEGVWGILEAFQWWEKNKQIREVGARLPSTGQQQSRIYQNCLPLPCYYMRRMGRRTSSTPLTTSPFCLTMACHVHPRSVALLNKKPTKWLDQSPDLCCIVMLHSTCSIFLSKSWKDQSHAFQKTCIWSREMHEYVYVLNTCPGCLHMHVIRKVVYSIYFHGINI